MTLKCADVTQKYLANLGGQFACETTGNRLRILTPYPYPDNDLIEVFVEEIGDGLVRVTDLGETVRHLYNQGFEVPIAKKRRQMAETIATGMGVSVVHGELVKEGPVGDIGELMFDVIVAARGVSDLILTSRAYEPATFEQEVGRFMQEHQIRYETKIRVAGRSGKMYQVNFRLPETGKLVEAVSPNQIGGLQPVFNRVLRIWVDVNGQLPRESKISILNDVDFKWGGPEVALLQNVSLVGFWSRSEDLASLLAEPLRATS